MFYNIYDKIVFYYMYVTADLLYSNDVGALQWRGLGAFHGFNDLVLIKYKTKKLYTN